jgi:hypothetical protein
MRIPMDDETESEDSSVMDAVAEEAMECFENKDAEGLVRCLQVLIHDICSKMSEE